MRYRALRADPEKRLEFAERWGDPAVPDGSCQVVIQTPLRRRQRLRAVQEADELSAEAEVLALQARDLLAPARQLRLEFRVS